MSSRLTLLTYAYGAEGMRSKGVRFVLGGCINLYKGLLIQEKSTGKKGMKGDGRWKKGMKSSDRSDLVRNGRMQRGLALFKDRNVVSSSRMSI